MDNKNVNNVLLSTVIAANTYEIPVASTYTDQEPIPVTVQNILITGTGTLARNVLIQVDPTFTAKNGWSIIINWRSNLTVGIFTLTIQGTDYTTLLTGSQSQDFQLIYLNGSWEVSNLSTTITGRLSLYALISNISGYITTFLSTWIGTSAITTLGTIATGIWQGTAIADAYIASAATWNAKAAIAGPTFTGIPKAPTNSEPSTNNTQIATTAFVQSVADFFRTYNAVTFGATIDLSTLVGGIFNTISFASITGNMVLNAAVYDGNISEITFIMPFGGAHTVSAGTNMVFDDVVGVSTHVTVLTVVWDVATSKYIQKSFSQN